MKLELKHILPYLDSGLKAIDNQAEPDDNIIEITGFSNTDGNIEVFDQHGNYDIKLSDIKPILRPLSDYADINSKSMCELNADLHIQMELLDLSLKLKHYTSCSYTTMQLCFENHIDVFGLIEKGLAIDFNETFTQK